MHVEALGTTAVRFAARLESQELACHQMQDRLGRAVRSAVPLATAAGQDYLQLVVDVQSRDNGACTSALEVAGVVLNCTHTPAAVPAWTSTAANVTVLAQMCEPNGTAQVVAAQTPTPPVGARLTLACALAGSVSTGAHTPGCLPVKSTRAVCPQKTHVRENASWPDSLRKSLHAPVEKSARACGKVCTRGVPAKKTHERENASWPDSLRKSPHAPAEKSARACGKVGTRGVPAKKTHERENASWPDSLRKSLRPRHARKTNTCA